MLTLVKNLKLESSKHGNFRLAKRKGKSQWTTLGYYDTIPEAFAALFDALGWATDIEANLDATSPQVIKQEFDRVIEAFTAMKDEVLAAVTKLTKEADDENSR